MSRAVRDLAARQAELRRRCAAERALAAQEAQSIVAGIARIDRVLLFARRWAANPLVIMIGIGLLVVLGRSRALRVAGAGVGLASTLLRLAVPLLRPR